MEYKTDSLLVHLARAGDEDACEKLVKKYYSSIYQYCLLHINDPYEAEDLTQEVFTRFFSNLYRYKEYGKVKNYLYTIAGNTVKNYYKKKNGHFSASSVWGEVINMVCSATNLPIQM